MKNPWQSNAEKAILLALEDTGSIKAAAKRAGRCVRRVQQVAKKHNIRLVNR